MFIYLKRIMGCQFICWVLSRSSLKFCEMCSSCSLAENSMRRLILLVYLSIIYDDIEPGDS